MTTGHGTGERRISFMIADDSQSQKSNSSVAEEEEKRSHLLKSGRDRAKHHQHEGANGRRYSVRIRKTSHSEDSRRRADSIRSRKASSVSGRSDISQTSSIEEGMSPHYEDSGRDREVFGMDQETIEYSDNMPWLESIITLCTRFSFICDHKKSCTLFCFYRIMRSCGRLTWSMRKINGDSVVDGHKSIALEDDEVLEVTQAPSGTQTPTTPSSHRKLKIFRKASHYAGVNRLSKTASLEKNGSVETVNKVPDGPAGGAGLATKSDEDSNYYPQNNEKASVMAKYVRQQVISLFAAPFAALAKGLLIMDENHLERLFPVCWELLLVDDEEVASLTATLCVVCAVKISKFVVDFIRREMNHEESEKRVDSVLK
jgi:Protein UNC80